MPDVANWAGLDTSPVSVRTAFRDPAAGDTADGGVFMSPTQQWLCTLDAVAVGDSYVAGIAVTPAGSIRVSVVDGALPAGAVLINGVAVTATGQLCISTSAVLDHYVHGWPVSALGVVIVDDGGIPDFARVTTDGSVRVTSDGSVRITSG